MNKQKIAKLIESKLSYTNGWRIPDDEYFKECLEISKTIVKQNEISILRQKIKDIKEFENYYFSEEFDSLTFSQLVKIKTKEYKNKIKDIKNTI